MHTYSHAVFTWAVARYVKREESHAAVWGAAGAALPDVPVLAKAAYLLWRHRDSMTKNGDSKKALLFFLLGWAGHNILDFPTHAEDARPPLWPLSRWRWKSPVSYWDRKFYALPCLLAEHGAILALTLTFLYQSYRGTPQSASGEDELAYR